MKKVVRRLGKALSRASPSTEPGAEVFRGLEARGELCRDRGIGRIFHPGAISYRETVRENALHVIVRGDHVSAHIDWVSPVAFTRNGAARYSVWRVVAHNLAGMAEDLLRALGGRRPSNRCGSVGEWVDVDDQLVTELLQPDDEESPVSVSALDRLRRALEGAEAGGVRRVPFNVVDQVVHLLERDTHAWGVQLETRVPGPLDEDRLRTAIGEALQRHPMARARKGRSGAYRNRDYWEVPGDLDVEPLRTIECPDDEALSAARTELHRTPVPLAQSPPLRLVLARTPNGDVLMLNVNHAATDGYGALRILRSVGRAYAGDPDPLSQFDFLAERSFAGRLAGSGPFGWLRRQLVLAERLRDLVVPPARLATERGSEQAGYGFHHVRLEPHETRGLVDLQDAGDVNDVLLAALHLAVGEWNGVHGAPCRRISVLVPANLRPAGWRDQLVGNFSLPARVSTSRIQRLTPARTLAAVAAQTTRTKRRGVGTAFLEVLSRSWLLPLWLNKPLVDGLHLLGDRFLDTAILADLGHVTDPPSFGSGAGGPEDLWFSAPARMPLGLSVGAVRLDRRLHLVFRYRHPQFDDAAARRFADYYLDQLRRVADVASLEEGGDHWLPRQRGLSHVD